MPELPEIETIRRGLLSLEGQIIESAETMRENLRIAFPENFCENLENRKILSIARRSKYLLFHLDNESILVVHLGMSGKITLTDELLELKKHDHVIIEFRSGDKLIYNDARRFGLMTIIPASEEKTHKLFADLGVEPLEDDFSAEFLYKSLQNKSVPIKNSIMEGKIVVGVGNIYVCESLFRSAILPTARSNSISKKQSAELYKNIKTILAEAISSGGSTLRDYVQASGDMGYFQHKFAVYGRENEPCLKCATKIKRIKQQGRSTFYCPKCQK